MTEDELREIEDRAAKATPGPWELSYGIGGRLFLMQDPDVGGGAARIDAKYEDAEFAAHARADVDALVAEVRFLLALLRKVLSATLVPLGDGTWETTLESLLVEAKHEKDMARLLAHLREVGVVKEGTE